MPAARFGAAAALAFAPVFVANLVFAQRFRGEDVELLQVAADRIAMAVLDQMDVSSAGHLPPSLRSRASPPCRPRSSRTS